MWVRCVCVCDKFYIRVTMFSTSSWHLTPDITAETSLVSVVPQTLFGWFGVMVTQDNNCCWKNPSLLKWGKWKITIDDSVVRIVWCRPQRWPRKQFSLHIIVLLFYESWPVSEISWPLFLNQQMAVLHHSTDIPPKFSSPWRSDKRHERHHPGKIDMDAAFLQCVC